MKLSTRVRYGLRALVELADVQRDSPVLLDRIAGNQGISRKYLDAIFARLKAAGIVTSSRGVGGGFQLAQDPKTITVASVFAGLEGPLTLVDCHAQDRHCGNVDLCPTVEVWAELSGTMTGFLEGITVWDLVLKKRDKAQRGTEMYYI
jgi:Rrf2 family protein